MKISINVSERGKREERGGDMIVIHVFIIIIIIIIIHGAYLARGMCWW